MAEPIDTGLSGDIWHLGIEDLLAPLPETIRLGGPGPFVINLSTSSAPIDLPGSRLVDCGHAQLYQLQRLEERRPRYRLRLGVFATEDEADAILLRVRETYPGALTATADAEDLRVIGKLQPKAAPPRPAAKSAAPEVPVLTIVPSRPTPQAPPAPPAAISPPTLTAERKLPPRMPVAKPAAAIVPPATAPAAPPPQVREVREVRELDTPLPSLESTQTVRALTQLELNDEQVSRWFVIQLSLSEEAFDPETVPNLDIFSVYRLYSVAGIDQGRIVHALRLGFFSEEIAASAVASYLAEFYDKPAVKRVSSAERQRFAEQPLEARKDVGATGKQAVIEITDERYIRERRSAQAAAKATRS